MSQKGLETQKNYPLNKKLKEMNNIIINYANSTADTGEFDEFVQSKAGQYYFELNKELYKKMDKQEGGEG